MHIKRLIVISLCIFTIVMKFDFAISAGQDERSESFRVAIQAGNEDQVKQLLQEGVDANIEYHDASQPLFYAILNHNSAIIDLLLGAGADVNYGYHYVAVTPLMIALDNKDIELACILITAGADIDASDAWGKSVFDRVRELGSQDMIDLIYKVAAQSQRYILK